LNSGRAVVGRWFLDIYSLETEMSRQLVTALLPRYCAVRRATRARHLDDPSVADPARFLTRARQYLEMVEPMAPDAACAEL
jgi:hypothetical protein